MGVNFFLPSWGQGLKVSKDEMATTTQITPLGASFISRVWGDQQYLIASASSSQAALGVIVSTDFGVTWSSRTPANSGLYNNYARGVFCVGSTFYVISTHPTVGTSKLSVSTDGGVTFTTNSTFSTTQTPTCLFVLGTRIYIGTYNSIWISTNSGATWLEHVRGQVNGIYATANAVYVAKESGFDHSANDGGAWTSTTTSGLASAKCTCVWAEAGSPDKVYVGGTSACSISTDGGDSFTYSTTGKPAGTVEVVSAVNSVIYIGLAGTSYIYTSTNGGLSWSATTGGGYSSSINMKGWAVYSTEDTVPTVGGGGTLSTTGSSGSRVRLSWTKATDESQATLRYLVYYGSSYQVSSIYNCEWEGATLYGTYTDIASVDVGDLPLSETKYFNVIVKDLFGNKAIYNSTYFSTNSTEGVAPVVSNSALTLLSTSETSVTLNWTKATDAVTAQSNLRYLVYYTTTVAAAFTTVADIEANGTAFGSYSADINSKVVTGLTPSTAYLFNVIVKDDSANKSAYSIEKGATKALYLYAGTQGGLGISLNETTWSNKTSSNGLGATDVKSVVASGNTLYAGTLNGLSVSTDYGATWLNKLSGLGGGSYDGIWSLAADGNTIYCGTVGGVSVTSNGGTNFSAVTGYLGSPAWIRAIYYDTTAGKLYVATDSGLSVSSNGTNWTTYTNATLGISSYYVLSIYASGTNIYLGSYNGLRYSLNGGTSWLFKTVASSELPHDTINKVYGSGSTLYLSSQAGLLVSRDNLATFFTPAGLVTAGVGEVTKYSNRLYVAVYGGGVGLSLDDGSSFTMKTGLTNTNVNGIFAYPDAGLPTVSNGAITSSNIVAAQMDISWNVATDGMTPQAGLQYLPYYSTNSDFSSIVEVEVGTAVGYYSSSLTRTITGLTGGTTYYINVIVKDSSGNKATYTKLTQATAEGTPPAVGNDGTIAAASVAAKSLTLNWTKADDNVTPQGSLLYLAYQSTDPTLNTLADVLANGTPLGDYVEDINTKAVTGLTPQTTYYFNVIVQDAVGNQAVYSKLTQATLADLAPTVANKTLSTSSVNVTQFYVSWNVASDDVTTQNALEYCLFYSTSSAMDSVAEIEAGTSVGGYTANRLGNSIYGLSGSTTYYVNVIVKDGAGNKTAYTKKSQMTLAPDVTPPTPGNGGVFTTTYIGKYGVDFRVTNPSDDRDQQVYSLSGALYRSTLDNISTVLDIQNNGIRCVDVYWDEFNGYASPSVGGLTLGTAYYFNVLTSDSTGNQAVYQTLQVTTLPESVIPTLPIGSPSTLVTFGQGTESSVLLNQGDPYGTNEYVGRIYTFASAFKGQLTLKFKVKNATGSQYGYGGGSIQGAIFDTTQGYPDSDTYALATSANAYSYSYWSGSPELEPSSSFNEVSFVFNNLNLAAGTYRLCMRSTFSNNDGGLTIRKDTTPATSGTATHGINQYQLQFDDNYTNNLTLEVVKADVGVVNVVSTTTNSADLSWTKATDNVTLQANLRYAVYRHTNGTLSSVSQIESTATLAKDYTVNINTATLIGLSVGTTYWFYVVVKDEAQNKTMYLPVEATTSAVLDVTEPNVGTAISYTNNTTGTSVTVNWGAASDDTTPQANLLYKVVRATSNTAIDSIAEANAVSGSDLIMDWTENTLSVGATGLASGGTYYFAVLVKDASDNMSLYSPVVVITPDTEAPAVGLPISYSNVTPTTITVSWGAASDNFTSPTQLQYKLVKASTAEAIDTVAEADAITGDGLVMDWSANVLTSPAVVSGVTYFAVLVKDQAGNKSLYDPAPSAVDSTPPTPVGSVTVAGAGPKFVSLLWQKATDDITSQAQLKYAVYQHATGSVTDVADLEATGSVVVPYAANRTNASITGLLASTSCWFYVVVKDAFDNKAMYPVVNISTSAVSDPVVITGDTVIDNVGGNIEVPAMTRVLSGATLVLNVQKLSNLQKAIDNTGTSTILAEPGATLSLGNGETITVLVKTLYKLRIP
jgi:hypothetical protein